MSRLPAVRDGLLITGARQTPVPIGSERWFAWLSDARSFTFAGAAGSFTARHEERSGHRFWYAYRQRAGTLRKTYLGRTAVLTLQRLEEAARTLAQPDGTKRPEGDARGAWSPPLITTKLVAPQPATSLVARPVVVARCLERVERPCAIIAAPPGFGKTTLLLMACEQLRARGWGIAWLSLEEADRDPARFWHYVLAALDGVRPGISNAALHLLATPRPASPEHALPVVINELAATTAPIALVLDDYHRAATPASDRGLAFLIEHAPALFHLVIATRSEPALPLARLRAQGRIAEIHAADLRFSEDEAARFMHETMRVALPVEQLRRLEERTEGWVAGLQLAALSLRDQEWTPDLLADGADTPRYIAEYLIAEVLEHQPEDLQAFLLRTAPLERLTGPLCDAVTGRTDSAAMLARLTEAQLFVTPLDAARTWYRYHHLFAEVLRERLARTAPEVQEQCHRRAAAWLQEQGITGEAIRHLIAARAFAEAAPLIESETDRLVLQGEITGLIAQVRDLPRDIILLHPHLCVLFAAGLLMQAEVSEATAWVNSLERRLDEQGARTVETEGEISVIRAFLLLYAGDILGGAALGHKAVLQLPPGNQLMRALALWLSNIIGILGQDDLFAAEQTMAQIAEESLRAANLLVGLLAVGTKAQIEVFQGRLHRAARTCREALRLMPAGDISHHPIAAMIYGLLGEIRREWNDLDGAEGDLRRALAFGNIEVMVEGPIALALVQAARGSFEEAHATFDQIPLQVTPWDVMQIEVARARVLLAEGQLGEAARWAEVHQHGRQEQQSISTLAHFGDMEELVLARVALALGAARAASDAGYAGDARNASDAVGPLEDLCVRATRAGRFRDVMEARMLLARLRWMSGEIELALRELEAALSLAAPEGFVRVFLDEGEPLADLLAHFVAVRPPSRERAHAQKLLVAFGRVPEAQPSTLHAAEMLSPRELEVLRLLATGRSNEAIASELVVALSTVKWHVAHIYRKLGVNGRVRALSRARELRLIA